MAVLECAPNNADVNARLGEHLRAQGIRRFLARLAAAPFQFAAAIPTVVLVQLLDLSRATPTGSDR